jgi:hypothetical protein
MAIPLAIVTLGIGQVIWGLIVWANGQTPALTCHAHDQPEGFCYLARDHSVASDATTRPVVLGPDHFLYAIPPGNRLGDPRVASGGCRD